MRIISANLNQRLGNTLVRSRVEAWLASYTPDLFLSQEPFQLMTSARPDLAGFRLLATNPLTSCWIAGEQSTPAVLQLSDRWQKILLDGLTLHNVYLSPYSAKERCGQLQAIAADLSASTIPVIVGDFNLAPRPEDGVFGDSPSTFTTAGERKALTALLNAGALFDSTRPGDGCDPAFTFERTIQDQASRFRCDLALISECLRSSVRVVYDHSVRERALGFTDHSAVILDIADLPVRVGHGSLSAPIAVARPSRTQPAGGWTSATLAAASHKTAMRRRAPSQIARNLVAQGVLKELGVKSILDFGCAYGADEEFYRENGLLANGFDIEPRFGRAQISDAVFDLVTVVYVVNVLPTLDDRFAAVRAAAERVKPGGYILLVARSDSAIAREAQRRHWEPFNDGWISNPDRGTFQKGIRHSELAWLLGAVAMPIWSCGLRCSAEVAWALGRKHV